MVLREDTLITLILQEDILYVCASTIGWVCIMLQYSMFSGRSFEVCLELGRANCRDLSCETWCSALSLMATRARHIRDSDIPPDPEASGNLAQARGASKPSGPFLCDANSYILTVQYVRSHVQIYSTVGTVKTPMVSILYM